MPEQQCQEQLAQARAEIARWQADADRTAARLQEAQRQIEALHGVIARLGSDARAQGPQAVEEARCRAEEALRGQAQLQARLDAVLRSRSWRLTRPLRWVVRLMRRD